MKLNTVKVIFFFTPLPTENLDIDSLCYIFLRYHVWFCNAFEMLQNLFRKDMLKFLKLQEKKKKKETNNRLNVFTISLVENISRKVLK